MNTPSPNLFPALPPDALAWVYVSEAPIPDALADAFRSFLPSWTSHGRRVHGDAAVLGGHALVVAAHVPGGAISGCGIDAHVREVERLGAAHGLRWASGADVAYRDDAGRVRVVTRAAFKAAGRDGIVTARTAVLGVTPGTVSALREGDFERPAAASWHARLLPHTASAEPAPSASL